jgi:hypothetical protein
MDLGRHPLTVDDELIAGPADVRFGDFLVVKRGRGDGRLGDGLWTVAVRFPTTQTRPLRASLTSSGPNDLVGRLVKGVCVRNARDPELHRLGILALDDGGMFAIIELPAGELEKLRQCNTSEIDLLIVQERDVHSLDGSVPILVVGSALNDQFVAVEDERQGRGVRHHARVGVLSGSHGDRSVMSVAKAGELVLKSRGFSSDDFSQRECGIRMANGERELKLENNEGGVGTFPANEVVESGN